MGELARLRSGRRTTSLVQHAPFTSNGAGRFCAVPGLRRQDGRSIAVLIPRIGLRVNFPSTLSRPSRRLSCRPASRVSSGRRAAERRIGKPADARRSGSGCAPQLVRTASVHGIPTARGNSPRTGLIARFNRLVFSSTHRDSAHIAAAGTIGRGLRGPGGTRAGDLVMFANSGAGSASRIYAGNSDPPSTSSGGGWGRRPWTQRGRWFASTCLARRVVSEGHSLVRHSASTCNSRLGPAGWAPRSRSTSGAEGGRRGAGEYGLTLAPSVAA